MSHIKLQEYIKKYLKNEIITGILLCLIIFLTWSWLFSIYSIDSWKVPIGYQGDAWIAFAFAKAYMNGEVQPFLYQFVPSLNAPFSANWNDYAVTEDLIYASIGWLGRLTGLYAAANIMVLLAHLSAGLSFWYVSRQLKYRGELAFAGGVVYAFCHYIMARSLGHLVLSFFWHVPLLLLVTSWAFSKHVVEYKSGKFIISSIVAVICGAQNPYYTGMFLQFVLLACLMHTVRRQFQRAYQSFVLIILCFSVFLMMNANTILYGFENGLNTVTGGRNLASLEVYGLKIPELFLTPGNHFLNQFVQFSFHRYYGITYIKGEYWSPYLGILAIIGFFILIGLSFYRLLQGKFKCIPLQFWLTTWVLLYSIVGGVNLLLGTFGIQYFRASNRYSIFILTISLLFLLRYLTRKCPKLLLIPVSLLMIIIGFAEEFTARFKSNPPVINPISIQVESDKNFAQKVEQKFPNSLVFQLPVAGFPEVGPINNMGDYEHFRPYFYTNTLHYSYGTNKGRGDADWQKNIAQLAPKKMALELEKYGFSVVMINKKGYVDEGEEIISELLKNGKCKISENKDLIAIALNPLVKPLPIERPPYFGVGWSDSEGEFRWAKSSKTKIILTNNELNPQSYSIAFTLSAISPRKVSVIFAGKLLGELNLDEVGKEVKWYAKNVVISPGKNILELISDNPPISAQNGDPRLLSFKLSGFSIENEKSVNDKLTDKGVSNINSQFKLGISKNRCPSENVQGEIFSSKPIQFLFKDGWSVDEGTHRWSTSREAIIELNNPNKLKKIISVEFALDALTQRGVSISLGSKEIAKVNIEKLGKNIEFKSKNFEVPPGKSTLILSTDSLPIRPGNGDQRTLSLKMVDFNLVEIKK